MSLADLTTALATGQLVQTFAGALFFPDGAGGEVRSSKRLTVTVDPIAFDVKSVAGLQVACLGRPSLLNSFGRSMGFYYQDTCPGPSPNAKLRALTIEGRFVGWDAQARAIEVDFAVTAPFAGEADFDRYAADGTLAGVRRVLDVSLPGGGRWTWHVGSHLVDPAGRVHAAGGMLMSDRIQNGVTVSRSVFDFGGPSIEVRPSHTSSPGGEASGLVPLVEGGRVTGCTLKAGGKESPCTLRSEPPVFFKR
jgi:hypothetical protein